MESQMELSWKQRDPRWNPKISSAGSKGIQDGIPDGTQLEAKESEMESQMELRRKQRNPRCNPRGISDGSKRSKGCKGSQDGTQMELRWNSDGTQMELRWNPSNPRANVRHIKKTGHNWSVFKIYRELNDYSATTSNEKVPFTFL